MHCLRCKLFLFSQLHIRISKYFILIKQSISAIITFIIVRIIDTLPSCVEESIVLE